MALAGVALQKTIYFLLSQDGPLIQMLGPGKVFDYVPDGTAAPFIVLGDDGDIENVSAEFSDLQVDAHEQTVTLHTWTEVQRGRLTVKTILSRIHDVLIDQVILLDGFIVMLMVFVAAHVLREEDGLTYHGIFRCRCVTQPMHV